MPQPSMRPFRPPHTEFGQPTTGMNYPLTLILRVHALLLTLLLALLFSGPTWAQEPLVLDDAIAKIQPTQSQQSLLLDPTGSLTIEDILAGRAHFNPAWQEIINLGYLDTSLWVKLQIDNHSVSNRSTNWVLEIPFARLTQVDIYVAEAGTLKHKANIGNEHPFSQRTLSHHFFAEPLRLVPGHEYEIYLNIARHGGGIQVPIHLYRQTAFTNYVTENNAIYGVYFGIMFAMLVYNSFLLLSGGSRAYVYYLLHIVFTSLTFLSVYGYGFKYFWPEYPALNDYVLQITVTLAAITVLLFTRHYIEVGRYRRWMDQLVSILVLGGWLLIGIRLTTQAVLIRETAFYAGMSTLTLTMLSLICWRLGSRPAGYFLLAWMVLLAGSFLHLLALSGALPNHPVTNFSVIIGSAVEVLTLSLGLADRINSERRKRYLALQEKHSAVMELKAAEEKLIQRAMHNSTTGLPNRALLRTALDNFCKQASAQPFSLLLLGLDNFHEFNKTLGHNNGDAILSIIACELDKAVRESPVVLTIEARPDRPHRVACIEGVTFALLLRQQSAAELDGFCKKLLAQIERPFDFQGLTLEVNASIGIVHTPDHGTNHEDLLRNAHIALEMANNQGNRIAVYSREMDPYNSRRISLLAELREAIRHDALDLHLQPQIALHDNSVVGVEVLVRWQHPEHGFIAPGEFIPLAERTGVIHPLTFWVCRQAFALCRELQAAGINLNFSINISARNLQAAGFSRQIEDYIRESGIVASQITMELTETAVMLDREDALRVMNELAQVGVRLSIDDFGTGYSSLSYLKQLPVDEIKIDRSFVKDMLSNKDDHVIVHTTLSMGHNLGLKVVAEGIEDAETLQRLKTMGCDLAQGYHIAKPMPATAFKDWWLQRAGGLKREA